MVMEFACTIQYLTRPYIVCMEALETSYIWYKLGSLVANCISLRHQLNHRDNIVYTNYCLHNMRLPVFGDDPMIPFYTDEKIQISLRGLVVNIISVRRYLVIGHYIFL